MGVATGTFQYPNGSPVASGLYQWKLSGDAIEFSGTTACIVPPVIKGNLDANGNLTTTFAFNDVLSTTAGASTTYQLTVKDVGGGQVWNETYYLTGTAANLNLIPPGGAPQVTVTATNTSILLETNGATNSSQSLLNLQQGSGVTVTNTAGTTTISATGGSGGGTIATGQGYFMTTVQPWMVSANQGNGFQLTNSGGWPGNLASLVLCALIQNPVAYTSVALQFSLTTPSASGTQHASLALFTSTNSAPIVNSGIMTFTSATPTGPMSFTYAAAVIPAGGIYAAFTSDVVMQTAVAMLGLQALIGNTGAGTTVFGLLQNDIARFSYSSISSTGAAMIGTLGALTPCTVTGGNVHEFGPMPYVMFV